MKATAVATYGEMVYVEMRGDIYTAYAAHGTDIFGWPIGMRFVCTVAEWPKYEARNLKPKPPRKPRDTSKRDARRAEDMFDLLMMAEGE